MQFLRKQNYFPMQVNILKPVLHWSNLNYKCINLTVEIFALSFQEFLIIGNSKISSYKNAFEKKKETKHRIGFFAAIW